MNRLQRTLVSLLSMFLLITAGSDYLYAQSQYRRGNSANRSNSEYRPSGNDNKKGTPANAAPGNRNNNNRESVKPPANSMRPGGNHKESSGNVRPGGNQRPPAGNVKPGSNQRPPAYNNGGNRPHNGVYAPPPAGHHKPKPMPGYGNRPPRPSVHFYGYYIERLPYGAKIIHRGPYDYYYVSGRYYRYINNVYVICRPPVGAIIAKSVLNNLLRLTNYAIRDAYGRSHRYYTDDDGVYYLKSGSNYVVVDPPIGAIVYDLPYGFEEVTLNGTKYYKVDDNFYELVYNGPNDYYFRFAGALGR